MEGRFIKGVRSCWLWFCEKDWEFGNWGSKMDGGLSFEIDCGGLEVKGMAGVVGVPGNLGVEGLEKVGEEEDPPSERHGGGGLSTGDLGSGDGPIWSCKWGERGGRVGDGCELNAKEFTVTSIVSDMADGLKSEQKSRESEGMGK